MVLILLANSDLRSSTPPLLVFRSCSAADARLQTEREGEVGEGGREGEREREKGEERGE